MIEFTVVVEQVVAVAVAVAVAVVVVVEDVEKASQERFDGIGKDSRIQTKEMLNEMRSENEDSINITDLFLPCCG